MENQPKIFKFSVENFEQTSFHPIDKIVYVLNHRAQEQTIANLLKQKNTNGILELITLF